VLWCQIVDGFEVMISECVGVQTLHHLIINSSLPHDRLLVVWKDVVETLVHVWKTSQHKFQEALCPRFFPDRIRRIREGLYSTVVGDVRLSECWNMPIIINNKEYLSVSESLDKINQVGKPTMGVVCHGDPQPSNIIVGDDDSWYCVDWEWSGPHHDWRMMLAHLFGWW
jgi:thiamine kinase-like enzyme